MDGSLVNLLLTLITFIIAIGGGFVVTYLNQKIESQKIQDYYTIAKQIVMAIEQLNPQLTGADKKELALAELSELTNNNITSEQANILIESAIYEIKKLLPNK